MSYTPFGVLSDGCFGVFGIRFFLLLIQGGVSRLDTFQFGEAIFGIRLLFVGIPII